MPKAISTLNHVTEDTKHQLLKQIKKVEIVSFDIFDTLIFRPFAVPSHLFWLMDRKVADILNDHGMKFHKIRVEAENEARAIARKERNEEDVTLDQIYEHLQHKLQATKSQLNTIKKLELDTENKLIQPNPIMREVLKEIKAQGKTIIFVSDMYMTTPQIKKILSNHGFAEPDFIFMSSETKKMKLTGEMFSHILQEMDCKPKDILHIGDNDHSDIKMAKAKGLRTFHTPKPMESFLDSHRNNLMWGVYPFQVHPVTLSIIIGSIANRAYGRKEAQDQSKASYIGDWQHFGYYVVGILYFAYIQWVIETAQRQHIDTVYFLARDGYIMKQVYDIMAPHYKNAPKSIYTLSSRRAFHMARIRKMDARALEFLLSDSKCITVKKLLNRIGLDPKNYKAELKQCKLAPNKTIRIKTESWDDIPAASDPVRNFFRLIQKDIIKQAKTEREALLAYFDSIKLGSHKQKQAIVDIGWHGNLQNSLIDILEPEGKNADIVGMYFGLREKARVIEENGYKLEAFLFKFDEPYHHQISVFNCVEIFELFFSAPGGSLINMQKKNGKIIQKFDESDCDAGRLAVIEQIHKGALELITDLASVYQDFPHLKISTETAIHPLRTIIDAPTRDEIKMFEQIWHVMDFGNKGVIVKQPDLWKLLVNPKAFAEEYRNVFWKKGYNILIPRWAHYYLRFLGKVKKLLHKTGLLPAR